MSVTVKSMKVMVSMRTQMGWRRRCAVAVATTLGLVAAAGVGAGDISASGSGAGGSITRVSVNSRGAESYDGGGGQSAISANGRFVAFETTATNMFPGDVNPDSNGFHDIVLRDRSAGTTRLMSMSTGGVYGNGHSLEPAISANGRYVAFGSWASNLVPGDTNNAYDVFVRDRLSGTTSRASVDSNESQGNDWSGRPALSADGRYVVFEAGASNLVPGDNNIAVDVFVRDQVGGTTTRASVSSASAEGNSDSFWPVVSADGRFVAFVSNTTNLIPDDTNGFSDTYVRDLMAGTTYRVSLAPNGVQATGDSIPLALTPNGRYVVLGSDASNLIPDDTNSVYDIFVRDQRTGRIFRVSVANDEGQGNAASLAASISADGRYVAFSSDASNLVASDTNNLLDVFLRDRATQTTRLVSVANNGTQGNDTSLLAGITANGREVLIISAADNLIPRDTNGDLDVFVWTAR